MTVPDLRDMLSDKPLTPFRVAAPEKEPSDSAVSSDEVVTWTYEV
jgi:hypothetical protein